VGNGTHKCARAWTKTLVWRKGLSDGLHEKKAWGALFKKPGTLKKPGSGAPKINAPWEGNLDAGHWGDLVGDLGKDISLKRFSPP